MLFLFFGYGTKLKHAGEAGERACPRCHNTTRWRRLEQYRYLSLFFVRIARWHRERLVACPVCGYAEAQPAPPASERDRATRAAPPRARALTR